MWRSIQEMDPPVRTPWWGARFGRRARSSMPQTSSPGRSRWRTLARTSPVFCLDPQSRPLTMGVDGAHAHTRRSTLTQSTRIAVVTARSRHLEFPSFGLVGPRASGPPSSSHRCGARQRWWRLPLGRAEPHQTIPTRGGHGAISPTTQWQQTTQRTTSTTVRADCCVGHLGRRVTSLFTRCVGRVEPLDSGAMLKSPVARAHRCRP